MGFVNIVIETSQPPDEGESMQGNGLNDARAAAGLCGGCCPTYLRRSCAMFLLAALAVCAVCRYQHRLFVWLLQPLARRAPSSSATPILIRINFTWPYWCSFLLFAASVGNFVLSYGMQLYRSAV
jgi:hypothetical protein